MSCEPLVTSHQDSEKQATKLTDDYFGPRGVQESLAQLATRPALEPYTSSLVEAAVKLRVPHKTLQNSIRHEILKLAEPLPKIPVLYNSCCGGFSFSELYLAFAVKDSRLWHSRNDRQQRHYGDIVAFGNFLLTEFPEQCQDPAFKTQVKCAYRLEPAIEGVYTDIGESGNDSNIHDIPPKWVDRAKSDETGKEEQKYEMVLERALGEDASHWRLLPADPKHESVGIEFASGRYAQLAVKFVPQLVQHWVEEYNGKESVHF